VCRDPRDDKYLALAAAGLAASIVSGDVDLLSLKLFLEIPILSPAQFVETKAHDA
jgi:predicted nucleic acid-binding protein